MKKEILKRNGELKRLYEEVYSVRLPEEGDVRTRKIEKYFDEVHYHVFKGEMYPAIFKLTRIATMLGEIRITYGGEPDAAARTGDLRTEVPGVR